MKIKIPYLQWKKAKNQLGVKRLADKVNYKGLVKHSYVLSVIKGKRYPRYHFETQFIDYYKHIIDIHIDWIPHTESDSFHPLIDKIVSKINAIK